jgi:hypothetical protein
MASKVEICNRALQKLGAKRITALTDDSVNARACNFAYDPVRLAELQAHPWAFAVKRATLAASATAPTHTKTRIFPLPADYLRLLPNDPEENFNTIEWQVEGNNIVTNDDAPLNIRYVADITDPNAFSALFREALSAKLALELAEELSQSNTKKRDLAELYDREIAKARKQNAFVSLKQQPPEDSYITVRLHKHGRRIIGF